MRIVSYNILDGGEGRADPLAEVIEAQRPDVVALVEATDLTVIERIARRLGFDYVHAPGNCQFRSWAPTPWATSTMAAVFGSSHRPPTFALHVGNHNPATAFPNSCPNRGHQLSPGRLKSE